MVGSTKTLAPGFIDACWPDCPGRPSPLRADSRQRPEIANALGSATLLPRTGGEPRLTGGAARPQSRGMSRQLTTTTITTTTLAVVRSVLPG